MLAANVLNRKASLALIQCSQGVCTLKPDSFGDKHNCPIDFYFIFAPSRGYS